MIIPGGSFDLRGYNIVRTQFFASAKMISVSFSQNGIRFSSACIRGFVKTDYVELKVHPINHVIAVLPCSAHDKNRICWARTYADKLRIRTNSAKAYLNTLFEIFNWDLDNRYRLRGEIIHSGQGTIAFFNARTPEIFAPQAGMIMPWATGFGDDYYSYKESKILISSINGATSEYETEPGLHPTPQADADESIQLLIEEMQSEKGKSDA